MHGGDSGLNATALQDYAKTKVLQFFFFPSDFVWKHDSLFFLYQMQACTSCHILLARMHNQSYEGRSAIFCTLIMADIL